MAKIFWCKRQSGRIYLGKIVEAPKSYKSIGESRCLDHRACFWRWGIAKEATR
jgi:hypothetical protein